MGFKYTVDGQNPHFLTHTIVDWVDLFTRREMAMVVIDSLNYCVSKKSLEIFAWCLMPSHLHMIASVPPNGPQTLSDVMRDFKSHTSREVLKLMYSEFESRRDWLHRHFKIGLNQHQVWKEGMHPIELYSKKFRNQKLEYIHENPVAAGIVDEAEHYLFSSARDYYINRKGLVDICYLD